MVWRSIRCSLNHQHLIDFQRSRQVTENTIPADHNSSDPMQAVAGALSQAGQAMRDGATHAKEAAPKVWEATEKFVSRFTYTTCYTISFGVVFPVLLVGRAIPKNNAIVHGMVDGAVAAKDSIEKMKTTTTVDAVQENFHPQPA